MTDPALFTIPPPSPSFWIGVTGVGPSHAILDTTEITAAVVARELGIETHAACRARCVVAAPWGWWDLTNPRLADDRCSYCSWHVAITQGTTASLLGALHPDLARLCRVILDAEQGPRAEYDPDHPRLIELLAWATDHGPWELVGEDCAEGLCSEHEEVPCPRDIACKTCTLTAGGWAGEWAGNPDPDFIILAPCSVTALLRSRYLAPTPPADKEAGRDEATQASLL